MSPQIALHDPVFRAYFCIVLISVAIAGAVLAFLRFVLEKETASMFKTYWSWILIAGIGFIVVFLGRIPTIVGITSLALQPALAAGPDGRPAAAFILDLDADSIVQVNYAQRQFVTATVAEYTQWIAGANKAAAATYTLGGASLNLSKGPGLDLRNHERVFKPRFKVDRHGRNR